MRRILDFECKSNVRHFVVGEDELEYPLREKAMSEIVHVLARSMHKITSHYYKFLTCIVVSSNLCFPLVLGTS